MKKGIFFIVMVVLLGACMKDYQSHVSPGDNDQYFQLKVGNAVLQGDTAYAAPGIQLKFWLDSLPEPAGNYSYYWNLGEGSTSTSYSPEHMYELGTYEVSVLITKTSNGQTFNREIVLVVTTSVIPETTIILLESNPVPGGNYNYKLALKSSVIYNYENTTALRWIIGDFTNWNQQTVNEVTTINEIEYLVYHLVLPSNELDVQRFSYGRGNNWAYAPYSPYWKVNSQGEGAFEAYFTNGQMSPNPITGDDLPGDGGDVNQSGVPATIRTQIVNESLRIFINYGAYANGSNPFIKNMNGGISSLILTANGWGYKDFPINSLSEGYLYWKFGPNINSPNVFGEMDNSKFYLPADYMLGLQIVQLKSGEWHIKAT